MTFEARSAERPHYRNYQATPHDRGGWMVFVGMYSISNVRLSDRAVRALFAAIPSLTRGQVLPALQSVHKADRAGWRDDEVALAAHLCPTVEQLEDAMRSLRPSVVVGSDQLRLTGAVVRWSGLAPGGVLGAAPWLSATIKGAGKVRPMDRHQLAVVLADHYQKTEAARVAAQGGTDGEA